MGFCSRWVIILVVCVAGCVLLPTQQRPEEQAAAYPPTAFAHSIVTTQVVLDWNCERLESGGLRLDGVARNPYASEIRLLEFTLVGVDATGHVVSRVGGATKDFVLRTHEVSPFRLDLLTRGKEIRFDLSFRQGHVRIYRNGVLVRPLFQTGGTDWSLVPDACPPTSSTGL